MPRTTNAKTARKAKKAVAAKKRPAKAQAKAVSKAR